MNYPIKTNQLIVEYDYLKINDEYDIYKITNDKFFTRNAYIFDSPLIEKGVLSVCYTYGKSFYILLKKRIENKDVIRSIIDNSKYANELTFERVDSQNVYKNVLLQLFLNSIYTPKNELLRFNNLTGHLYIFNPSFIKRSKINGENVIRQIPCIEVKIDNDLCVRLNVKTFTSLRYKKLLAYNKIDDLPKYILSSNNILVRKTSNNSDNDTFVIRQFPNKKNEIAFLDLQNHDKFMCSKLGVLSAVFDLFNKSYAEYIKISFNEILIYESIDYTSRQIKENVSIVSSKLHNTKIKFVDLINNDYSKMFIDDVAKIIENKYDVKTTTGKRVSKNYYNICVIHNRDYYNGTNDPHDIQYKNKAVQHITLENFQENVTSAVSTIIHEILIKQDIIDKRITLYDWPSLNLTSNIMFASSFEIDGVNRYFVMDIKKDGTFEIAEQKLDLLNVNEYSVFTAIFEENNRASKSIKGIVKDSDDNINIIRDTNCFTIPELSKIKSELENGNTYLRGKDKRDELISACTDVKYYEKDGCGYYFTGVIGNGMRARVINASNIRRIEPYNESKLFFDSLVPLMSVPFVRNNQLTVIPFPFKYLREYININKEIL